MANTSLELTRNNQSYVSIPHNDSLIINGPMTMEFWIKLKSPLPNDFQVILDKGNISTSQYYVIHEARNGNNQIKYRFGNGHERTFNRPASIIGEWTHMAFVWDGSNMIFYENGELIAFETFPVTFSPNTMPLTFGRMSAGGAYLDGFLDNVRIWNVARSAEEINTNKDILIDGNTQGLIGLWEFDEGTGTNVNDLSVNDNNGTITNGNFSIDAPPLKSLEPPTQALPVKLGEMEVSNVFLGEIPITKIFLGAELLYEPAPLTRGEPIIWRDGENVEISPNGTLVTKVSGNADGWDAGAMSVQESDGTTDFIVEYIPDSIDVRVAFGINEIRDGLEYGNKDIDFAWEINNGGENEINVKTNNQYRGTYNAGDVFRVAYTVADTTIRFYQNDEVLHEVTGINDFPIMVNCSLRYIGGTFSANLVE